MIDPSRKTLVFDFGNIFVNLDYGKCFRAFKETLHHDFSKGLPPKTEAHLFSYERGKINTESFLWHLQQYNPKAEIRDIIDAWNSILGELPLSRLDILKELRMQYNVVMLSNINELHIERIHRDFKSKYGIDDFHSIYFDRVYYSCWIGMRKPDAEIFNFLETDLAISADQILFIDDTAANITASEAAGWTGQLHNPQEDIINNISSYLNRI